MSYVKNMKIALTDQNTGEVINTTKSKMWQLWVCDDKSE